MFITTRVSLSICLLLTSLLVVQCQDDDQVFVAQEDWQEIREGQKVPGGLHYRMNLETGKKEAKLLSLEDTDSGKGIRLKFEKAAFRQCRFIFDSLTGYFYG